MAAFLNVCRFTPSAGGTADWTYAVAVTGYQSPAAAGVVNGRLYKYRAESADLSQWEVGEGAYNTSTGVLARTTVLFTSSGTTSKINFATTPQVAIVALKEDLISVEESNSFTATQRARARANIDVLKKNYIINGGMQISQQNGSTAGVSANVYYAVDQFYDAVNGGTSAFTFGQVAGLTPGGAANRIRTTVTAVDSAIAGTTKYHVIVQKIEGLRFADLLFGTASAKTITIQFGVKAPAGTYSISVLNGSLNRCCTAEYTISAGEANTDVVKSVTIAGDTTGTWASDNTTGIEIRWSLMVGSGAAQPTTNTWVAANYLGSLNQFNVLGTVGNVFELFDVGLYEGNAAPSFQLPDIDDELRKCKRYWRKSYELATAPGSATTLGLVGCGMNDASSTGGAAVSFDVPMRTAPTLAYWDGNGNANKISYLPSNTNVFSHNSTMGASPFNASQNGFSTSGPNAVPHVQGFIHYIASARL